MLNAACPEFDGIDWTDETQTRLMVGATEIKHGIETVFDSDMNMKIAQPRYIRPTRKNPWRTRQKLSLAGVAASGTLPTLRRAEMIGDGVYWDGLYSQNPPVREFVFNTAKDRQPNEIWIVRINPQQCVRLPRSIADIEDRQNELSGNLSLDKELDAILTLRDWLDGKLGKDLAADLKDHFEHVTLRTIKMTKKMAAGLQCASKYDRSQAFVARLRKEGRQVARAWLDQSSKKQDEYPLDAGYEPPPASILGDWYSSDT
jgi:NTE family protein